MDVVGAIIMVWFVIACIVVMAMRCAKIARGDE